MQNKRFSNVNIVIIIKNNNKELLNGLKPSPSETIATNSLSLFSFKKHKSNPKININGTITVIKLGIR